MLSIRERGNSDIVSLEVSFVQIPNMRVDPIRGRIYGEDMSRHIISNWGVEHFPSHQVQCSHSPVSLSTIHMSNFHVFNRTFSCANTFNPNHHKNEYVLSCLRNSNSNSSYSSGRFCESDPNRAPATTKTEASLDSKLNERILRLHKEQISHNGGLEAETALRESRSQGVLRELFGGGLHAVAWTRLTLVANGREGEYKFRQQISPGIHRDSHRTNYDCPRPPCACDACARETRSADSQFGLSDYSSGCWSVR